MRAFLGFTKRNMMLYFKDFQAVFFSLLTSIIILVLYLLFLKGTFVDGIEGAMHGLEEIVESKDIDALVNGLLLVGIMGSAMITIPYNCLTTIVRDRENRIDYDIASTPMKRWKIVVSYFISAALCAFIMTAIILTAGLVLMKAMGDPVLDASDIAKTYGVIALGSISSTAFFMVVVLAFKSTSASSAFFGILASVSGFVIGAYIPIAQFSEGVQTICNLFPAAHVVVMLRNTLLTGVLGQIDTTINGLDGGEFVKTMKWLFSFSANAFGQELAISTSILYVAGGILVCVLAMIIVYSKTYRRK